MICRTPAGPACPTYAFVPALLLCAATLAACGPLPGSREAPAPQARAKPEVPVTEDHAGTITHHVLVSRIDGSDIPLTLFEPMEMKKGGRYPLVLYGHGWSGSRVKTPDFLVQGLIERGFYVISFDQRGFGESGGTVRVMDPDYDGQDLVQILDWAEELPGLKRFEDGRMAVGSSGGSYGGMFQYALAGTDPEHRLRVISPDIAPYDLNDSLNPNGVFKSFWGGGLLATMMPPIGKPDAITTALFTQGTALNTLDESYRKFLSYHSLRYFCEGLAALPQSFPIGTADTFLVPPGPLPKIDAFITQGFRDTMFSFNQGHDSYQCLRALGGDVRLATHQAGHIFSYASMTNAPGAEDFLDPLAAVFNPPSVGDVGGNFQCGAVSAGDVRFAWFEAKLQGKTGALDALLPAGEGDICLSLAQGDGIRVHEVLEGGTPLAVDAATPQFNGYASTLTSVAGEPLRELLLSTLPLYVAPAEGAVLAGIPSLDLTLRTVAGESPACAGINLACDPILLLGIGHRRAGQTRWDLVDDQLTPLRGFGAHTGRMVGVAERLQPGDELALLIYGFNAQYPLSASRDVLTPALSLSGHLALPLLDATGAAQ